MLMALCSMIFLSGPGLTRLLVCFLGDEFCGRLVVWILITLSFKFTNTVLLDKYRFYYGVTFFVILFTYSSHYFTYCGSPFDSWTDFIKFYVIIKDGDLFPSQTRCQPLVLSSKFNAYEKLFNFVSHAALFRYI